jgi:hypothetical protein
MAKGALFVGWAVQASSTSRKPHDATDITR